MGEEWALDNGLSVSLHVHEESIQRTQVYKSLAVCALMRVEDGHSQAKLQKCVVERGL